MLRNPDTDERICEQCKQPFERQYARRDRKFCGAKCKQLAYRHRIWEQQERESHARQLARQEDDAKRKAYNAKRRKTRKPTKRRRSTKP